MSQNESESYELRLQNILKTLKDRREEERRKILAKLEQPEQKHQQKFQHRPEESQLIQAAYIPGIVATVRSKKLKSSSLCVITKFKGAFKRTQSPVGRLTMYSTKNISAKSSAKSNLTNKLISFYQKIAEDKAKKTALEREKKICILINLKEAEETQNGIVVSYREIQRTADLPEVYRQKKVIIQNDTPQTRKRLKLRPKELEKKVSDYIINIVSTQQQIKSQFVKAHRDQSSQLQKIEQKTGPTSQIVAQQVAPIGQPSIIQTNPLIQRSNLSKEAIQGSKDTVKQNVSDQTDVQAGKTPDGIKSFEVINPPSSTILVKEGLQQIMPSPNSAALPTQNPFLLKNNTKTLGLEDVIVGFRPTLNVNIPAQVLQNQPFMQPQPAFFPTAGPGFQPFVNQNTQPTSNSQLFPGLRRTNSITQSSFNAANPYQPSSSIGFFPQQSSTPFFQTPQFSQLPPSVPFMGGYAQPTYQQTQFADNPQAARECFAKQEQPVQQSLFAPEMSQSQNARNRQRSKNTTQRIS